MSQRLIAVAGQKNTKFTNWDINQQYRPGDMVVYNSIIYTVATNIPAGTPFGPEWSIAVSGGTATFAENANVANVANVALAVDGPNVTGIVANAAFADSSAALDAAGASNVKVGGGLLGQVLKSDGVGNMVWAADTATPAAPDTSVQFNTAGSFGGDASYTFAGGVVTMPAATVTGVTQLGAVSNVKVTGGSSGFALVTDGLGNLSFAAPMASLPLANGTSQFDIPVAGSNVVITANAIHNFTFGASGNLTVPGAILPAVNILQDLGSPTQRFRDLYLSNNTIHLGTDTISANAGNVSFSGNIGVVGIVTTGNVTIAGNLTVTGNTTQINVNDLVVQDPIIAMGGSANGANATTYDGKDRGLLLQDFYPNGSGVNNHFFGWKSSTAQFEAIANVTTATGDVMTGTLGNIAAATFIGDLTGTVLTAAQTNITAVGTLTGLAVSGSITTAGGASPAPSISGFSTISAENLNLSRSANLGNVANIKITGGSAGQYLQTDGNGNLIWTTADATPAGANTEVQFNDNGVFGTESRFTYTLDTSTLQTFNLSVTNNISSDLIPSSNVTFDLGSVTQRWKDLYLSNNTIYMGDQTISANATHLNLDVTGTTWSFSADQFAVPENGAVTFPKNTTRISENVQGTEVEVTVPTQTVTGTGTGATLRVRYTPGSASYTRADGRANGTGYANGDQVLVLGSLLGGVDGVNDLTVELATVDGAGVVGYGDQTILSGTPVVGPAGLNIETDGDNWSFANRTFTVPGDIQNDGQNDFGIICDDWDDDGLVMKIEYKKEGTVTSYIELEDERVKISADSEVTVVAQNPGGSSRWAFNNTGKLILVDAGIIETADSNLDLIAYKSSTFADGNEVSLISAWNDNAVQWTKATVGYEDITFTTNMGRGATEHQWTLTQTGILQLPEYNNEQSSLIGTRNTITTTATPITAPVGTPTMVYQPTTGVYSYKAIVTIKHDTGGSIDIETFEVMASTGDTATVFSVSNRLNTLGSNGGLNDATVTIGAGFDLIINTKYGTTNTVTFTVTEFN